MAIGILTGSGTYALPGFAGEGPAPVATPWGEALVSRGEWAGVEVLHVSRHGPGHPRLSNHVAHRANVAALQSLGASAVLAVTVCGAVDAHAALGSLVCFDDLHFVSNRLPDGSLCTFFTEPGARERGHWIYEAPFSEPLRRALLDGARDAGGAAAGGGGASRSRPDRPALRVTPAQPALSERAPCACPLRTRTVAVAWPEMRNASSRNAFRMWWPMRIRTPS